MSDLPFKQCQLCGRTIRPGQAVCKCGSVVPDFQGDIGNAEAGKFDWGAVLPWVPLPAALLLLFWLFSPPFALYYSILPVFKLYAVVVLLSSALALLAADRMKKQGIEPRGDSPLAQLPLQGWFPLLLIAWPVAFPAFLRMYYEDDDPTLVKRGYITTGSFLILVLLVPIIVKGSLPKWTEESSTDPVAEATPTPGQIPPATTNEAGGPPAASPGPAVTASPSSAQGPIVVPSPQPGSPAAPPAAGAPATPAQPQPQAPQPPQPDRNNPDSRQSFGVSGLPKVD